MKEPPFLRYLRYIELRVQRMWRHSGAFWLYTAKRFREDECPLWAAMLCYASLLALVPLMVVAFGIVSAFPASQGWTASLQAFLFQNFVPTTGDVIQDNLERFVIQASELSAFGMVFLVATSIFLIINLERVMNVIWRAPESRGPGTRFVVYWSVLTVGPLLFGASVATSSYISSLPLFEATTATLGVQGLLLSLAPIVSSALAFTLIFVIVPNIKVPWRYALIGGVTTAILFETAKQGFSFYIGHFPAYETIYGAFAVFPIFLVWAYLSWLVTLAGASFAAALQSYRPRSGRQPWPSDQQFALAFYLARHLWRAQKDGEGLTIHELLKHEPRATYDQGTCIMQAFDEHRLATLDDEDQWVLTRNLDDVTLGDLWRVLSPPISVATPIESPETPPQLPEDEVSEDFRQTLDQVQNLLDTRLSTPLTELF